MYVSSEIASRIRLLARQQNIVLGEMFKEIGLNANTMTNFRTSMPKADNLAKIADYLDCSVDFLLGRTESIEVGKVIRETVSLPDDEQLLLSRYRRLDPDGKELVRARALECLMIVQQGEGDETAQDSVS